MPYYLSPIGNDQMVDANGNPIVGGKIRTYLAGTTTPATTYTSSSGGAQSNPIILNSLGIPSNPIWLLGGVSYKFTFTDASDVTTLPTVDNIAGVNDSSIALSQWTASNLTPTYISTTSFSVTGDQTPILQVGRRLQFTVTAGTVYGSIATSVFGAVTTVTLTMDAGQTLDSGLSAFNMGIITPLNTSAPTTLARSGANTDITSLATVTTTTQSAGDNSTKLATTAYADRAIALRGYIDGFVLSTAGSSATMTIGAGAASDSTGAYVLSRSSSIAKTTSAWAVGTATGGLDTGAIANNTWYHFYVIRRPDTGVVDVLFSTSASSPTLPTNYTQFRRIGSGRTNGSAQWTLFVQTGELFLWDAPVLDVSANNPGTAAVTRTLTVPTGVVVESLFNGGVNNTASAVDGMVLFSPLSVADQAPSRTANALANTPVTASGAGGVIAGHAQLRILTNTSAQIRSRLFQSDASCTLYISTLGWRDTRGRDA